MNATTLQKSHDRVPVCESEPEAGLIMVVVCVALIAFSVAGLVGFICGREL